jgi:uncharacterized lipoprotein YbaY/heat shock protein HslJ
MDHEENMDPVPEGTEETASQGMGADELASSGADELAAAGAETGEGPPGDEGPPGADEPEDSSEPKEPKKRSPWLLIGLGALGVLLFGAVIAALAGALSQEEIAPTEPPSGANAFITIVQPGQSAVLPVPESIPIRGQAGGLFENNVVVQAFDSEGTLLAEEPATVDASEPGGTGNWEVDMVIPVKPGTRGLIFASSTSPVDGSITASASVEVTYGEELPTGGEIKIDQPKDGAVLDTALPVTVSGTGRGLFENNVVVEVLDSSGNVIVQEPTTMQTEEVGGAGTWSIDIRIPAGDGEKGTIHAFSTSPQDGSIDAEDRVGVQYGEETTPEPTAEPTAEPPPDTNAGIEDLLWSLNSLGGIELVPGSTITMDLTDRTASGSAGCNTYSGPYELSDTSISLGQMATTRMACPELPGVMDQENQYLIELQNVEAYSIQSDGLQMFGSQSPVTLFYDSVVMGTVGFMQPLEIPSGSTLTVQLQDTSLADAPAKVLGETVITDFSVIPIPFSVGYDPTEIDTRFTYSISARITDGAGNLIFINTTAYNVITNGNPSVVELMVEPV